MNAHAYASARPRSSRVARAGAMLAAALGLAAAVLGADLTPNAAGAASCGPIRDRNGMIIGWVLCPLYDSKIKLPDYQWGGVAEHVTQPQAELGQQAFGH